LLFTHDHSDHFSNRLVLQFLLNNPETVLVSTPDVIDALVKQDEDLQERLTAIQLDPGDILEVEAFEDQPGNHPDLARDPGIP